MADRGSCCMRLPDGCTYGLILRPELAGTTLVVVCGKSGLGGLTSVK
jgi:hypothetical protein